MWLLWEVSSLLFISFPPFYPQSIVFPFFNLPKAVGFEWEMKSLGAVQVVIE